MQELKMAARSPTWAPPSLYRIRLHNLFSFLAHSASNFFFGASTVQYLVEDFEYSRPQRTPALYRGS